LANVSAADMGTYALHVPRLRLFNTQAILFVSDFAVVPGPVVHGRIGNRLELRWDLTALRQLHDVTPHQVPAIGN